MLLLFIRTCLFQLWAICLTAAGCCMCGCCLRAVQVDRWLQPYLQLALSCLANAENRLLKDELLVFISNALYYNAGATLQILQQFNAVQQLFGVWFGFIFERT